MGDKPYPTIRSGADLRQNRKALGKSVTPQPASATPNGGPSGME